MSLMLLGHRVFSILLVLSVSLFSEANAYVRNGDTIYFLTTDYSILPSYCLYEMHAPESSFVPYQSKLSEGSYGNLLYASRTHLGENYDSLKKIAKNGNRSEPQMPINKGTRADYKAAKIARESGDQFQIAAFEKLDSAGIPFTLKAVDDLAMLLAPPTKQLDLTHARPIQVGDEKQEYGFGQYVLVYGIDHNKLIGETEMANAYQMIFDDIRYRWKTKRLAESLTRLGNQIRKDSTLLVSSRLPDLPGGEFDLQRMRMKRTEKMSELEARTPDETLRGEISDTQVENMKRRFIDLQEKATGFKCTDVPKLR